MALNTIDIYRILTTLSTISEDSSVEIPSFDLNSEETSADLGEWLYTTYQIYSQESYANAAALALLPEEEEFTALYLSPSLWLVVPTGSDIANLDYVSTDIQTAIDNVTESGSVYVYSKDYYTGSVEVPHEENVVLKNKVKLYGGCVINSLYDRITAVEEKICTIKILEMSLKGNLSLYHEVEETEGVWSIISEYYTNLKGTGGPTITANDECTIEGITIQNSINKEFTDTDAILANGNFGTGAAIYCNSSGTTEINRCSILDNESVVGAGAYIYNDSAPQFSRCNFTDNKSSDGGNIVVRDIKSGNVPSFSDCVIDGTDNSDILIDYGTDVTFTDCQIESNIIVNRRNSENDTKAQFTDTSIFGNIDVIGQSILSLTDCTTTVGNDIIINAIYNYGTITSTGTSSTITSSVVNNSEPHDSIVALLSVSPATVPDSPSGDAEPRRDVILVSQDGFSDYFVCSTIKQALENSTKNITVILVAQGIYYESGLELIEGVNIYGGFSREQIESYDGNIAQMISERTKNTNRLGNNYIHETVISSDNVNIRTSWISSGSILLDGLTISDGLSCVGTTEDLDADGDDDINDYALSGYTGIGGGIQASDCSLNLTSCTFKNNVAFKGGAIGLSSCTAVLTGCLFVNNSSKINGGALFCENGSVVTLESSHFIDNSCVTQGAAINIESSSLVLHGCFIVNNYSLLGSALTSQNESSVRGIDCVIANNTSSHANCIYLAGTESSEKDIEMILKNCVIYDNGDEDFSIYDNNKVILEGGTLQNKWYNSDGTVISANYASVATQAAAVTGISLDTEVVSGKSILYYIGETKNYHFSIKANVKNQHIYRVTLYKDEDFEMKILNNSTLNEDSSITISSGSLATAFAISGQTLKASFSVSTDYSSLSLDTAQNISLDLSAPTGGSTATHNFEFIYSNPIYVIGNYIRLRTGVDINAIQEIPLYNLCSAAIDTEGTDWTLEAQIGEYFYEKITGAAPSSAISVYEMKKADGEESHLDATYAGSTFFKIFIMDSVSAIGTGTGNVLTAPDPDEYFTYYNYRMRLRSGELVISNIDPDCKIVQIIDGVTSEIENCDEIIVYDNLGTSGEMKFTDSTNEVSVYFRYTNCIVIKDKRVSITDASDAPTITILGDNPYYNEYGHVFSDPGISTYDKDGVAITTWEVFSNVNIIGIGSYSVTYNVTDSNGNTATATRSVTVRDTTGPEIIIIGDNPYIASAGISGVTDQGATAFDKLGRAQTVTAVIYNGSGTVVSGFTVADNYTIVYSSTDSNSGVTSTATRYVYIFDSETRFTGDFPVITLIGEDPYYIEYGSAFSDPGVNAIDSEDGILTATVSGDIVGTLETDQYITYTATDTYGNVTTKTRTVKTRDTTGPVIYLYGDNPYYIEKGQTWTEPGHKATDAKDGDCNVTVSSTVDTSSLGSYTVTYTASDNSANQTSVSRTVEVVNKISGSIAGDPYITPIHGPMYVLPCGSESYLLFDNLCYEDRYIISGKMEICAEEHDVWYDDRDIANSYFKYICVTAMIKDKIVYQYVYDIDGMEKIDVEMTKISVKYLRTLEKLKRASSEGRELMTDLPVYRQEPEECSMITAHTVKHGSIILYLYKFKDRELRNALAISSEKEITKENSYGALVSAVKPKNVKLKKLNQIPSLKAKRSWSSGGTLKMTCLRHKLGTMYINMISNHHAK